MLKGDQFLTQLDLRVLEKAGHFVLIADLDFYSESFGLIRAPKGFITDLASVPKGLRWLISVNEKHRKAAVIHDYVYSKKGAFDVYHFTRSEADHLFDQAMKASGVSWFKRKMMIAGVRAFGWVRWSKL